MTAENPVDYLIRRTGLTRLDFTNTYGLGANHLLLLSQGRKESVGPNTEDAIEHALQARGFHYQDLLYAAFGTDDLNEAYSTWVKKARQAVDLPEKIPNLPGSPFGRLVRHLGSIARTAKTLRVRDVQVKAYIGKPEMPSPVREALTDIGYPVEVLDRAQKRYFKDKDRKR